MSDRTPPITLAADRVQRTRPDSIARVDALDIGHDFIDDGWCPPDEAAALLARIAELEAEIGPLRAQRSDAYAILASIAAEVGAPEGTRWEFLPEMVRALRVRVIESPEELDELPLGTVLRESGDRQRLWELVEVRVIGFCRDPWWLTPGEANAHQSPEIVLPATALHIPAEENDHA